TILVDEARHKGQNACPVKSIVHGRTFIINDSYISRSHPPAIASAEYFDQTGFDNRIGRQLGGYGSLSFAIIASARSRLTWNALGTNDWRTCQPFSRLSSIRPTPAERSPSHRHRKCRA